MSRKANPVIVGAFVVGGFALLLAGLIVFSSIRLFPDRHRVVTYFRHTVFGLRIGAPVMFKGFEVGRVEDIRVNLSMVRDRPEDIRIQVILEIDQHRLAPEGTILDLDNPATIPSLVRNGLRAELALESLLSGLRYVALDIEPDTPALMVSDPAVEYPEIPSLPGLSEELEQKVTEIFDTLTQADIEGLVLSARALIDGTRAIVTSPELLHAVQRLDSVTANLDAALVELAEVARGLRPDGAIGASLADLSRSAESLTREGAETAGTFRQLLNPDGAFLVELEQTLSEVHDAARSLRLVSDQLGRDPGVVLRGGQQ